MKKLFAALLALCTSVAFGTTTVPVQLLNPTGSSSGQAIVSTGASSAPAWGGVGVNGIAAIAANTVLANATASSASPTAFAMPSCSTSASALNWTTSTGFTCNTAINAAQLGGATFAAPGPIGSTTASTGKFTTLQATSTITPATTSGIVGTTLADNANAGSVGEMVTATVLVGSAVAISNGIAANVISISLTAGDWDVWGSVFFHPAGTTVCPTYGGAVNTTSASIGTSPNNGAQFFGAASVPAGAGDFGFSTGVTRINVSTTTTVFLVAYSTFTTSTNAAYGFIGARRVR